MLHVSDVFGKQQKSDSIQVEISQEKEQIKTAQKIVVDKKLRETNYLCEEIMNSKRQVKEELGHVLQIRVCRLA